MRTFASLAEFEPTVGTHLGYSDWLTITQDRIDTFADATGDHQWIHVDPVRAAAGPFGAPIAHGFLTLSLIPVLVAEIYTIEGLQMSVNYGTDRIRFVTPVPVDSQIRAGVDVIEVQRTPRGVQIRNRVTIEIKDTAKPACIAETIVLVIE